MPTLLLRHVPEPLYRQLKATAARHRRSMTQEAILSLEAGLADTEIRPEKPSLEDSLAWLREHVWSRPVLDRRPESAILGYDAHGLCD